MDRGPPATAGAAGLSAGRGGRALGAAHAELHVGWPVVTDLAAPPTTTAAGALADFCLGMRWSRLDEAVQERTRELLLDLLGVALAGSRQPSSGPAVEVARRLGGAGAASLIGASARHAGGVGRAGQRHRRARRRAGRRDDRVVAPPGRGRHSRRAGPGRGVRGLAGRRCSRRSWRVTKSPCASATRSIRPRPTRAASIRPAWPACSARRWPPGRLLGLDARAADARRSASPGRWRRARSSIWPTAPGPSA